MVMTGAKHPMAVDENTLAFKLPGGGGFTKDGINKVSITLDPADTYTVRFYRIRSTNFKLVAEYSDVYCDQLKTIFESTTGLRTNL